MKILFIAPRMHSNQSSLIQKLIEEEYLVEFFVMAKGNSEDYRFVAPEVIPIGFIGRLKNRLFLPQNADIVDYSSKSIPNIIRFYRMIFRSKSDKIIIRVGNYWYCILLLPYILLKKRKFILYSQDPVYSGTFSYLKKTFHKIISLNYSIPWITPVKYGTLDTSKLTKNDYLTYLPFFIYPQINDIKEIDKSSIIKFLCVSKYEKRKNVEMVVDAFVQLNQNHHNFSLTIIGSTGNDNRENLFLHLKRKIDLLNLNEKVKIIKNIPFSKMGSFYKENDVFLLPAVREPASISQLEAMSYGLAVICSMDNGTAHYVKDNHNGFIINPTLTNLQMSIKEYLDNPLKLTNHKLNSINLIKEKFSIEHNFNKLKKLLN